MYFCQGCHRETDTKEKECPICGDKIKSSRNKKIIDNFQLRPRFVFVYELLPSGFKTWYTLIILFIVSYIASIQFNFQTLYIIYLFIVLLFFKILKLISRKIKYRKIKYNVTNIGIEYVDDSKGQKLFLPYEDIINLGIKTNLATILFGYGHILVRTDDSGIYLDYIAHVKDIYDYISKHMNH